MIVTQCVSALTTDRPFERRPIVTAAPIELQESASAKLSVMTKESRNVSRRSPWIRKSLAFDNILIRSTFGTITGRPEQMVLQPANVDDQASDQQESRHSYNLVPAEWLRSLGLNHSFRIGILNSSIAGWQHTLQTARIVPDDSLIMAFCKQGNLDGVRLLFAKRDASVRDVDSMGHTPLWVRYDALDCIFGMTDHCA